MTKLVAYYRVSTSKQGHSGLGLDAQREAVRRHAEYSQSDLVAEFVEIESGKRADRPELTKALSHARLMRATLIVAKLDRLARNVAFTAALLESGVEFVCCDNPNANRLTIHILAAVAEDEARRISERTKAALAAAKNRGIALGASRPTSRNLTSEARERGQIAATMAVKERAEAAYRQIAPLLATISHLSIADQVALLNAAGHRTSLGTPWTPSTLRRVRGRTA